MFTRPEPRPDFPALEREILALWAQGDVFRRSVRAVPAWTGLAPEHSEYVFYDGPPFATGLPHYGHLLAGTLKDIVPRYWAMRGFRVERRFGWDTHGLPVEMEIEKDLGLNGPADILAYGVDRYNEACRGIVLRYTEAWRGTVTRLGRWVDFDDDYKTLDPTFMESVWWVFRALWDKGLITRGYKVMPYSWRLGTPLSNFEANMDYRRVQDPALTVTFPRLDRPGEALLAWTTTPWTLPSNMALCTGPDIAYVRARRPGDDTVYVLAEGRLGVLGEGAEVLQRLSGLDLVGVPYEPPFSFFPEARAEGAYRVVADDFVSTDEGTGIVHMAPAYGEDDWRICEREGVPLRDPVDAEGRFTDEVPLVRGVQVKEADKALIADLKARGRILHHDTLEHEYPFCWRSGTPLIYKAISTWFVRVTELKDRMVAHNATVNWVPDHVGSKRFGNWLADARDWAISRNRFWGTPLPLWLCEACGAMEVFGRVADLEARARVPVPDLHKHHVDRLELVCGACSGTMRRTPEVLDCWFESGAMPYAQNHYPFENATLVERNLPADFIAEGLDQTRGWFYTLLVLSTALFDRPAFRNVIVNGLILAEDGQKMSKRLRNYPPPDEVVETWGADALRAYLIDSPVVRAEPMRFQEKGVREVVRSVMLPLWNAYGFFATYAGPAGWTPRATPSPVASRAPLDRWIVSMVQTLVVDTNREMEAYRLYNVIPGVLGFIDHLTNWYIRRSRRRFSRSEDVADRDAAFETLYEVLTTFSRLLAPVLPFMAEVLYQRLEAGRRPGASDSVHLERFPVADLTLVDAELERAVAVAREVVTAGRNLREQQRIRTRQPLARLDVALDRPVAPHLLGVVTELLMDELNVKEVVWRQDLGELVTFSAKANFKALGKRLGTKMKAVATGVAALSTDAVRRVAEGGSVVVEDERLTAEDLLIQQLPVGGGAATAAPGLCLSLDVTISPALRDEGLVREVISRIQQARKDADLEVDNAIVLSLRTADPGLAGALERHEALVRAEVQAVALESMDVEHAEAEVDGAAFAVAVRRAG